MNRLAGASPILLDGVRAPVLVVLLALVFATLPALMPAQAAVRIQEVVSPKGVTAWLVEDYTVPIISMRFTFRGGSTQDPPGKEGMANLMTGLFDEGAGELDRRAFQDQLDDSGAEMSFGAGRDSISGSVRMLAEESASAFALVRLAVQEPRFDQAPLDRIRAQIVSGIEARARDPQTQAQRLWLQALYGEHPYAREDDGTPGTLATIQPEDIAAFHRRQFARGNLVVGVVGAIDAETLAKRLDDVFGDLPAEPDGVPVARADPAMGKRVRVDYDLPQTSIQLAYPGMERRDPQFFAAFLMNHILGGGTFSSRLFNEIREKRGLAYGVDSALVNRDFASGLVIGTSTRADRAGETLDLIRSEVARMAQDGPTAEELADAKAYVIGAYAINNLDSSGAIARTLVEIQVEELGIDYIERRAALIDEVTLDDVKAAARKLLTTEPSILIVGPPDEEGETPL